MDMDVTPPPDEGIRQLYLDLMKRCILGLIHRDRPTRNWTHGQQGEFDDYTRTHGLDWPSQAHSMIGLRRMENVQRCVEEVLANRIEGDLMETGVWRGGACIFMRAILKAHGVTDRNVWVADSFCGLPAPDPGKYPQDVGLDLSKIPELAISLEEVKENFRRYGLLDGQVRFLRGWFRDTLPTAEVRTLAVLRLDGDLYESTMDALQHLYPKLSEGGYLIVDDYGAIPACRQAVDDYRATAEIRSEIHPIDACGAYWQKGG